MANHLKRNSIERRKKRENPANREEKYGELLSRDEMQERSTRRKSLQGTRGKSRRQIPDEAGKSRVVGEHSGGRGGGDEKALV